MALSSCITEPQEPVKGEMVAGEKALMTKITGRTIGDHQKGCLLLYLDEKTTALIEAEGFSAVENDLFDGVEIIEFGPALNPAPKNTEVARELGLHRWFMVTFDKDIPVMKFAEQIAARPQICALQMNSLPQLSHDYHAIPFQAQPQLMASGQQAIPFNDPLNEYQWNLVNTGNKSIGETVREGADVGVRDAWKLTAGSPDVIVAVCDAPVKYTHPDLAAAMWVNEAELNGEKGVDDDGNDYIDDIYGYNFTNNSNGVISWNKAAEEGHGTHVAGVVAAVNGNGIGISSIAGGSGNGDGVRLMCCQIFDGGYSSGDASVSQALMYAADNGACIAQCSYGYPVSYFSCDNEYIDNAPLEYRALKYFTNPKLSNHPSLSSNIAIFAAGNESANYSAYPGALPMCISVTAFGPDYLPAGYTNYGRGCNIAAPGGDFWVGGYPEESNISQILSTCISEVAADYVWMQGTSMACPHVTGVAALGVSYAGKLGKKFSDNEFRDMLLTSVTDINQHLTEGVKPHGEYSTISIADYRNRMGTGAIDAWKLLMQIEGTPSVTVQTGKTCEVALNEYFGDGYANLTYLNIEFTDEAKKALGFATTPRIENGKLVIACTKVGSAKIKIHAIAGGKNLSDGSGIGGTEIIREISIVSRGVYSNNGGWL